MPDAPARPAAAIVSARGLRHVFGRGAAARAAVDGLDFDLGPGECLGLLGPNGSGKSTTLRLVLGLLPVREGSLCVLGGAPGRRAARAATGYVPEEARRFGLLSGFETVDLFARLQGVRGRRTRRSRVAEALAAVGLEERAWRQRVEDYSRGMARRLALAAAWVHRPRLLVLDEPTSGLDPFGVADVLRVLEQHQRAGGAALLSAHDRVTAEEACDRALVLDAGRVVRSGAPSDLLAGDPRPSLLGLMEAARGG